MCSAQYLLHPRVGRRRSNAQRTRYAPSPGDCRPGRVLSRPFWPFVCLCLWLHASSAAGLAAVSASTAESSEFIQNHKPRGVSSPLPTSSPSEAPVSGLAASRMAPLKFTQSAYTGSILENSPGKVYVVPDAKMGLYVNASLFNANGPYRVRFRIKSGDSEDFFKAEAELVGDFVFLIVRTRTSNPNVLNRERHPTYTLDIRARVREARGSKGAKRGSGNRIKGLSDPKTILKVTVVDTNDLSPFFQTSRYRFSVDEDTPLHASIGQVHAEDADEGVNGEIYYSILGSYLPSIFAVDPVTGILSLVRPLSFKEEPTHKLTLVAQDRGAQPIYASGQADTAAISIDVKQVNLRDPVMQIQHLPEVIEQSNADIYAIIRINDPDPGRHGEIESVEIIEGDPEAHFRIRPSNQGEKEFNIEVLQLLDREIAPYGYNLTIKAVDRGIPPRTNYKNIHVQLADLNDHAPVFDQEVYEVKVKENAPLNTPLVRLKVWDEDSGRNAQVRLNIAAGNEDGQFRIHPKSGVMFVAKPLDAEKRTSYTLSVSALDDANMGMRKQSSAKVRVVVEDVNDNDPMFESGEKIIYFNENEQPGTRVMRVNAMDADSGENGYISYSIANLDEVPFEIDHFTGIIQSKWLIDFESDQREYTLLVRASDWGSPYRRQAEMKLTVRIRDINDNRPQFERVGCVGQIGRETRPGTELITLSALDFDAGNLISYRIVSGNADGCFALDPNTGVISVVCDLRTLPTRERVLNVTATDGQHFSDVTPVAIKWTSSSSLLSSSDRRHSGVFSAVGTDESLFDCQETDVAKRLTESLALAARNNQIDNRVDHEEDVVHHFADGLLPAPQTAASDPGSRFKWGQNVHQPEFDAQRMPREIRVNETMPSGSVLLKVAARDRDFGFSGDLLYVISSGDEASVFKIDTESGELRIDGYLDREETSDYRLNITVFDQGLPQKSASRLLHIIVEDANDNAPEFFKSTFSFFFPENTRKGTPVVTLNATDRDEGLNGKVIYKLETETSAFTLNPLTGLLVVAEELDREEKEFYDLQIRASDSSLTHPLSSSAMVRVQVLDANDVAPKFTANKYTVKVREDLPLGAVVGMVDAFDPDLYQGGQIRFSLEGIAAEETSPFLIDEISGTIRVKSKLDYEFKQLYNLTVRAQDEGSPSLSSLCTFIVEVLDVNENRFPPRFDSLFLRTAIPENKPVGSHVATVTARDNDAKGSEDSRIAYSILEGDGLGNFLIDPSGNIKTMAVLDREARSHYWITVYAQDFGAVPLSSKLYVYIEVLNVNDNVPLTREPVYRPSIAENAKPFSHVVTLEAEDADDEGDEIIQRLTYEIVTGDPQSLFHIDSNTGIMSTTKRRLDREVQAEHVLQVRVSDNGKPPLNSTTDVIVTVEDVNDNPPEFLERVYKVQLPETIVHPQSHSLQNDQEISQSGDEDQSQRGAKGLGVKDTLAAEDRQWEEHFDNSSWEAFDEKSQALATHKKFLFRSIALDKDSGENGRIHYTLKAGLAQGKVQIDPDSGIVYAINDLRAGESYEMLIKATNSKNSSQHAALSRVSLQIKAPTGPHSKFAPKVYNSRPAQVFETDQVGDLVASVRAEDQDPEDQLWFSIVAGDKEQDFYITPDEGNILLARKLNWAREQFYNLTVSVTDGKFVTLTYVAVRVVAVNEVRPEFEVSRVEVQVAENVSLGSEIIRLNVSQGRSKGRRAFFSLHAAQNPASLAKFAIHPTSGVISVKERLDHERIRVHVLTVAVTDQGIVSSRSNYARVIIHIQDHNDHSPTFMSELIQTKIHETAEIGTEVIQALAIDNDQGENGRVSYSIASGNVGNSFSIQEDLGLIRVARPLDMLVESEYTLVVKASDHGEPLAHSNTVPVHILVTMSDDAPPRFVRPHYATEVFENRERGHSIIQVEARSRSALRYEIVGGNDESRFFINPSTGIVMVQTGLDFEEKRFYNLTLQVSNTVGMKAVCTLNVHVLDLNDNEPRFLQSFFQGRVSESASIGSLILVESHSPLVIRASDADMGVNSLLFFEIMDETAKRFFAIDESTGAIRTIMSLDYEKRPFFEFLVRVSDRGTPRLASLSMAKVRIDVMDENDSPPVFERKQYNQVLLLPTFPDVAVIRVNASDPDRGIQSNLKYSIMGGDEGRRFKMDPTTGQLRVAKESEVGLSTHYLLDIAVTDGKYSERASIHIQVEKSDNSGLAFGKSRYFASVLENSTKTDVIEVVTVLGATLNENLRFSLLNPCNLFAIGETSGAIRTLGEPFDREEKDLYELVVEVRSVDQVRALPRVAHVVVEVKVLDLNDNPPMFTNQPYHAVMSKDTQQDSVILQVSAVDLDIGDNGNIYFQLVKGNGELFRVGPKQGQITLRKQLESYQKDYKLTVAAYDGGSPPFSAEVQVHIKVIDKSVPVFTEQQLYKSSVREDIEVFSPVLSVEAESPNESGGKLIYTLEQGNEGDKFAVDHTTGVISVVEALDFETKPHYQLTLRATDGVNGGYAEAIVLLGVEDVNDCRPKFESDSYVVQVSESLPVSSKILTVKATDGDSGRNQEIEYTIMRNEKSNSSQFFNIDPESGAIFLKRSIDYEREVEHSFTLLATDKGPSPLTSSALVRVIVLDANDNPPVFEEPEYIMRLSDRARRGQFVGRVRAIDPDEVDADALTYSIIGGNHHQVFSMDERTGVITLINLLNFERESLYSLNVSVSDGVYSAQAKVRIVLLSANSFPPEFHEKMASASFPENSQTMIRIHQLSASDPDRDDRITYSLASDELAQLFRVDGSSGHVWALKSFDREHRDTYLLPIVATDSGGRSGFANLQVSITDRNDNKPTFTLSEYKINIPANFTVGSVLAKVGGWDEDERENAALFYSIYENTTSEVNKVFEINANTGQIMLKRSALALENQIYQFFVRAADQGSPPLHADVPVEVYIMSPLDSAPTFEKRDSVYYIQENSPIGRVVAHMRAHAHEEDGHGEMRYKMACQEYQDEDSLFQIDQDGRIIINGHLDRELKSAHKLTILAETDSSPSLNAYYDLTIQILDQNDNTPTFQSPMYQVSLSEAVDPHTSVIQTLASDADSGNNGEIRYRFADKSKALASVFHIDTHDGWITTQSTLDHETDPTYDFVIEAYDNGLPSLSSSTLVRIHVQDANDNPTVFAQRHFNAAVNEGALPGTIIFELQIEDLDQDVQTETEFFIIGGDLKGQFQIKKNGEMYVARPLDREAQSAYRLEVAITDGTFVSTCRVSIEILDDNDSPPVCASLYLRRAIYENVRPGTFVLNVEATDEDEGANARQIFYMRGEGSESFLLDRESGILTTALPLDRENRSSFTLDIHVQDGGMPEWECLTQVEVQLLDVNDNAPRWAQDTFSASLKEDMPVGTIATKIHATDADKGENRRISYELLESAKSHFKIDPLTGIVSLTKPVDREEQAMYNLTVRAIDHGQPKMFSETRLVVLILDVNDNPPEFASKYYFASVHEDVTQGADVVRVLATSKDSGVNADITYSIIGGNEHRKFMIDPKSGVLIVEGGLDHEKSPGYFLTIQAQDGGDPPLSNHATVNITVEDVNDNAPVFSQVSYTALINEAAPVGHQIISVTANDLDELENGRIAYSIEAGDRHHQFQVDEQSGQISVASPLDREMVATYVLEVRARDHGQPKALTTMVLVNVDVLDANDNPPIFPEGNYTAYVQEDRPLGHVLQRFTVTDSDDSPNGSPFTFDIRAGNQDDAFRVDQDGTLRTAAKFNHQVKAKYELQIRVFDNGKPPLFSDSFVTVNIIEESQFPPIVLPFDVLIRSYQDDFPGAVIGRVKASDQDAYDQLQYQLVPTYSPFHNLPPQSHLFEIDHNQGSILALQGLDVGSYSLNISVTDGKFTSFAQGRVVVQPITDQMLDHSVLVRFGSVTPEKFVDSYQGALVKMIKTLMNVRTNDVLILGIQSGAPRRGRRTDKRSADPLLPPKESSEKPVKNEKKFNWRFNENNLEVLFAVKLSKDEFYPRDKVRSALEQSKLSSLSEQVGLRLVEIQGDECQSESCQNGECQDQIVMNDSAQLGEDRVVSIASEETSFVAPRFNHQTYCACKQGFAGDQCQIIMNECAREPCPSFQECVPDNSFQGYLCRCPEGLTGALCNVNISSCTRGGVDEKCRIVNPMTFGGKSYAQYSMVRSIERHLSLSLSLKTLHGTGNVMFAVGLVDYSILEVTNGQLRYRFNFGSGEGSVTLNGAPINDGEWHTVKLERHGNSAKISLDNRFEEQGAAPGVNDILNLEDTSVYFGAEVVGQDIAKGFEGCLDDIRLDGISLPLQLKDESQVAKLKRFNNVEFKCGQLQPPGLCGSHPCSNGGSCAEDEVTYTCSCLSRFTGLNCENDLDPCGSNPCLYGAKCVNLKNDFHCECPPQLSGKRCHYGQYCNPNPCQHGGICEEGTRSAICKCRGYSGTNCTVDIDECLHQNPCQSGGTCVNTQGGFHCLCPDSTLGPYCNDEVQGLFPRIEGGERVDYTLKLEEVVAIICSLFLLVFIVMIWILCKKIKIKQTANGEGLANGQNGANFHLNDIDTMLNHNRAEACYSKREQKLNNLDLTQQERPLLPPNVTRPASCFVPHEEETSFNYEPPVRSYGAAGDDLEPTLQRPRRPNDFIQNIQKPMAAVAPSVHGGAAAGATAMDRNLMDHYSNKSKSYLHPGPLAAGGGGLRPQQQHVGASKMRVNLPSESPCPPVQGAASLSSLPASMADETASQQRYYWDSFDLNNQQHTPLPKLAEVPGRVEQSESSSGRSSSDSNDITLSATGGPESRHLSTLPPPGKPVDPSRDIETLNEDDLDVVSTADTEDGGQLGSVFPPRSPMTKSMEELLAGTEDIDFADEGEDEHPELPNSYDYHLHLNNYLPAHNVSETDTDEHTPMLSRSSRPSAARNPKSSHNQYILSHNLNANGSEANSDINGSIQALSEPTLALGSNQPVLLNGNGRQNGQPAESANGELDHICELEDSDDDDPPVVDVQPMKLIMNPRNTRV